MADNAIAKVLPRQEQSNPRKGAKYRELAINFVREFPIGTSLTWNEFCSWAFSNGLMDRMTPHTSDKQSTKWLAHLQRRHQAKINLNKAAQHSDMIPYGGAFSVESVGGALIVKDVAKVLAEGSAARRIRSVATTKLKQLEYLYQSTDWAKLPPHEQAMAEAVRDDIENWVQLIDLQAAQHEQKFLKLQHRINQLVQSGEIDSENGGIQGLLEEKEE